MYRDCVQVAKEIRAALKVSFPYTKFSVTTSRYSMGSSISIHWDNMPSSKTVSAITDQYRDVSVCSVTGDTLSGGNMFVTARADYSAEFKKEVDSQMSEYAIQENQFTYMNEWDEIVTRKYAEFVATQQPTKKAATKATHKQTTETTNTNIDIEFTIKESKHTKTGETIFVANPVDHLDRESFLSLSAHIKTLGGYYSNFKPNNGFIFKTDPTSILNPSQDVETVSNEPITINEVITVEAAPVFTDQTEYQAESIIEISANVIINSGLQPNKAPLTASEFNLYTNELATELMTHNTVITLDILAYIANTPALAILSKALECINKPLTATENNHGEFTVNNSPIWTITASQYQHHKKIKQPYICEISPYQMGRMSQRQKDSYFKQRSVEWDQSAECKNEYKNLLIKAFNNGLISLNSIDIHSEVKSIISDELTQRNKRQQEHIKADLIKSNKVTDNNQITIGQRVYSSLYGYGVAEKVNNKTVIMRLDSGYKMKVPIFSLQLQSNNDLLKTMP